MLLLWERSKKTYEKLDTKAHSIKWEIFEGLDHGFCDGSFKAFKDFYSSLAKWELPNHKRLWIQIVLNLQVSFFLFFLYGNIL